MNRVVAAIGCQCGNWPVSDFCFSPLQTVPKGATCFPANFHLKRAFCLAPIQPQFDADNCVIKNEARWAAGVLDERGCTEGAVKKVVRDKGSPRVTSIRFSYRGTGGFGFGRTPVFKVSMNYGYRKYLESDHWQELRSYKLRKEDARCKLCRVRNLSNDVHHLKYKKLYDVKLPDLVVLCRPCHNKVHKILDMCSSINKSQDALKRWKLTVQKIRRQQSKSYREGLIMLGMLREQKHKAIRARFKRAMHRLRNSGVVPNIPRYAKNLWDKRLIKWQRDKWIIEDDEWLYAAETLKPELAMQGGEH